MKNKVKLLLIVMMFLCCFSGCTGKDQNVKDEGKQSEEQTEDEEESDIGVEEQDAFE